MSEEREFNFPDAKFEMTVAMEDNRIRITTTFSEDISDDLTQLVAYPGFMIGAASKAVAETMASLDFEDQIAMFQDVVSLVYKRKNNV